MPIEVISIDGRSSGKSSVYVIDANGKIKSYIHPYVETVTGNIVDNTNPKNPIVNQQQVDWSQVNSASVDFIKNKPVIPEPAPVMNYTHLQGIPSATWAVVHNLNFYPNVMVFTSAGDEVEGAVQHVDTNNMIITFSAGFGGTAYLS